jgi:hypothetical protein
MVMTTRSSISVKPSEKDLANGLSFDWSFTRHETNTTQASTFLQCVHYAVWKD